jgi:hypothetical protein
LQGLARKSSNLFSDVDEEIDSLTAEKSQLRERKRQQRRLHHQQALEAIYILIDQLIETLLRIEREHIQNSEDMQPVAGAPVGDDDDLGFDFQSSSFPAASPDLSAFKSAPSTRSRSSAMVPPSPFIGFDFQSSMPELADLSLGSAAPAPTPSTVVRSLMPKPAVTATPKFPSPFTAMTTRVSPTPTNLPPPAMGATPATEAAHFGYQPVSSSDWHQSITAFEPSPALTPQYSAPVEQLKLTSSVSTERSATIHQRDLQSNSNELNAQPPSSVLFAKSSGPSRSLLSASLASRTVSAPIVALSPYVDQSASASASTAAPSQLFRSMSVPDSTPAPAVASRPMNVPRVTGFAVSSSQSFSLSSSVSTAQTIPRSLLPANPPVLRGGSPISFSLQEDSFRPGSVPVMLPSSVNLTQFARRHSLHQSPQLGASKPSPSFTASNILSDSSVFSPLSSQATKRASPISFEKLSSPAPPSDSSSVPTESSLSSSLPKSKYVPPHLRQRGSSVTAPTEPIRIPDKE